MRLWTSILGLLAAIGVSSCGDPQSPDAQIRETIAALETAAEERDVGGLMEHVSDQFRDSYGRDSQALATYVRGYFIANQAIHLLTRIESVEFPTQEEARAKVTVAMVGREAAEANAWNLAAEVRDFEVTLMREDGAWKVTHAKWARDAVIR